MSDFARPQPVEDCIFCMMIAGKVEATQWVHRDDDVIVIKDIAPQAPKHLLVIPTLHYPNPASFFGEADPALVAKVFSTATQLGREQSDAGFRLVANQGVEGGQTVNHVHIHVLAGRQLNWPPG